MTRLDTISFDIETTGFAVDGRLTIVGFDADVGSRICLNTGGRSCPSDLEAQVNEDLNPSVSVSVTESEQTRSFVDSTLAHRDVKLVAYNGERWGGGFDLPFLRTRLCYHRPDRPFTELPYIDAMDVFETRFNASGDTLTAVYEELVRGGLTELDPFADSEEAVEAWERGEFELLVLHNVADIRRTRDFTMKSLDPVA